MANDPWAAFNPQPAGAASGGSMTLEALPAKPPTVTPLQVNADRRAGAKEAREAAEYNATHNPDGSEKPKAAAPAPLLSEAQKREIRDEARQKIKLVDSLHKRSRDGLFATGFGSGVASMINGTTAADVAKDVETLKASGALTRIMEMSKANGGKNPLTPLSNADFNALGQSIANLDPTQSDVQFQRNLQTYRDIYLRAFKGAGGTTTGGKQAADAKKAGEKVIHYDATGKRLP